MSTLHTYIPNRVIGDNGIADGATLTFYLSGTNVLAPIYSDEDLTTPLTNPVVVPSGAEVPDIYLSEEVDYRRVVTYSDGETTDTDPYLGLASAGVSFKQNGADAVTRTMQARLRETLSVGDFAAVGDGSTNNDTTIAAAVANALLTGRDIYWPDGDYLTTTSIANFHDVKHLGPGRIKRGSDTWYITPTGTQTNIIYVGAPNLTANDGLGSGEATNISTAFNRMRGIGDKAQDGQWRIQMLVGTITSTGITIPNMPTFRNRLQVWGADVALTAVPTSIWDGTSSAVNYAIRGDWSNNMCTAFFHFKNIKFINWDNAGLAGAIVIWAAGDVLSENIHTDNCSIGEWYRQCQARVTYGRCDNAATYGVAVQYGASGNIGNLSGGGKTFTNCAECINIGRNTTSYIQGCDLSGDTLIVVSRVSRIRPQGNTYRAWTNCVFDASNAGIITPDNGAGSPDTFIQTPTESTPVMKCASGSKHQSIHTYDNNMHCFNDAASVATISGASGVQTLISAVAGVTGGDFVPARVPAWWAYSPTAQLTVQLLATLNANAGGTLALHSQGSAASTKLAEIVIPAVATFRRAKITLEFINRPNSSTGRYECDFKTTLPNTTAGASGFSADASASLNSTATRDKLDSILNYRLYWTPADANSTTFSDMRSFIVV